MCTFLITHFKTFETPLVTTVAADHIVAIAIVGKKERWYGMQRWCFDYNEHTWSPDKQRYNSYRQRYNSYKQRYNSYRQRYNSYRQRYNSYRQRYNSYRQRYNSYTQRYNSWTDTKKKPSQNVPWTEETVVMCPHAWITHMKHQNSEASVSKWNVLSLM